MLRASTRLTPRLNPLRSFSSFSSSLSLFRTTSFSSSSSSSSSSSFKLSMPTRSFFRVPGDGKGIENEYEHGKRKTLEETVWSDAGLERWSFGELRQPFGTFEKPVVVVSANPERIIGCVGDGGEFEHPLVFFAAKTNGSKYMCSGCGQFFVVRSTDPSVDPADVEKIAQLTKLVKDADAGKIPPIPAGTVGGRE